MEEIILKICTKCNKEKPISDFYKHKKGKDGYHSSCKKCMKTNMNNYYKTISGLITNMFSHTKQYHNISFTNDELYYFLIKNTEFLRLYYDWEKNKYDKLLTPTLTYKNKNNRLSDILLFTKKDFSKHNYIKNKSNNNYPIGVDKKVYQFDMNNKLINSFKSVLDATKKTNINNISACCLGKLNQSGGFKWSYYNL